MIRHHQHRYRRRVGWFVELGRELAGWAIIIGCAWLLSELVLWLVG